jgi:hypothetical protein
MQDAFVYVIVGVVVFAGIVALLSLRGERYGHIGSGGFYSDPARDQAPQATRAEIDEEARQMLEARNARRRARGQEEVDVEAELERLHGGGDTVDPALRAEVRELVAARNARRVRRGQEPLDVEAEVERQLRDLMG